MPEELTLKMKLSKQLSSRSERVLQQGRGRFSNINVWISRVDAELVADGLDISRIQHEVNRRLMRAGLSASLQADWQRSPRYPCLGILIHADRTQTFPPLYIFSVEVFYVQKLSLAKSPMARAMRLTWCREAVGEAAANYQGVDWSSLYHLVGALVDQFLKESLGFSDSGALPPPSH